MMVHVMARRQHDGRLVWFVYLRFLSKALFPYDSTPTDCGYSLDSLSSRMWREHEPKQSICLLYTIKTYNIQHPQMLTRMLITLLDTLQAANAKLQPVAMRASDASDILFKSEGRCAGPDDGEWSRIQKGLSAKGTACCVSKIYDNPVISMPMEEHSS